MDKNLDLYIANGNSTKIQADIRVELSVCPFTTRNLVRGRDVFPGLQPFIGV